MKLLSLTIFFSIFLHIHGHVTLKENRILSRKKRFLTFPMGSNLILTISSLKDILLQVPKGYRTVLECDVFFPLPSGTQRSYLQELSMHTRHRRDVHNELSKAIDMFGFNGDACIQKMICEAQYLEPFHGNSFFKKLLFTVFLNPSSRNITEDYCNKNIYFDCEVSMLELIMHLTYNTES